MGKLDFKIVTPEKIVYHDEVDKITIPTVSGEITVLPKHSPLVSLLVPGELRLKKGSNYVYLAVSGGFIEVRPRSKVVIMADTAERAEEIDLARAEEARQRALDMLKEKEKLDEVQFAKLQAVLDKELARIKVGKKYRNLKK